MIDASRNPRQNHLLDALPQEQWERWRLQLEYADMPLGQVLYEPGNTLTPVYFPTTAIISLLRCAFRRAIWYVSVPTPYSCACFN